MEWAQGAVGAARAAARQMLRPIPYHRPRPWHLHQERAFPATARVPVDAQGTVYALVGGRWEPRPWSMEPEPTWPRVASQRPNEPSQALDPAAISRQPPATPDPLLTPRHGLSWTDLGLPDSADSPSDATTAMSPSLATASATAPPGSFERVWGLKPPEVTPAGRGGSLG